MNDMKLKFVFNTNKIQESIGIVSEFLPDLKSSGMYHYFPFTEDALKDADFVQAQIARDTEQFHLDDVLKQLQEYWAAHKEKINSALFEYLAREKLLILPSYTCALTFYGPYGYYHTPDIVYLNITKGTTEFMIQTLLHEFLHLVLFERAKGLSDREVESIIDKTFVEIFGGLFPGYYVQ
jgi:hypothetical protein